MNSGERDELLVKLQLVKMRDSGQSFKNKPITSVGFGNIEYGPIPQNLVSTFQNLSNHDLGTLADELEIYKAPGGAKSDVYINGVGFSVKSSSAAPSALVNHTSRPGFENVCSKVGVPIEELDKYIDAYWHLRLSGVIAEDTKISDFNCPFKNSKNILKSILEYFLFIGTGSSDSNYPADYILEFSDPCNTTTWRLLDPATAVDQIWDKLVFCVRAKKGMPSGYNKETYAKSNAKSIARWTEYHSGNYRGALHIRLK
jgi:hypothetical protein